MVCTLHIFPFAAEIGGILPIGARSVRSDFDRSDVSRIRSFAHVKVASSPVDSSRVRIRITAIPYAKMQSTWSLRELVVSRLLAIVLDRMDLIAINQPSDGILGPVVRVSVELCLRGVN